MSKNYRTHRFFCIQCGQEGVPLARKQGHKHGKFHRKKLYCFHCKMEMNHVECKSDDEVYEFKMDYEEGVFTDEVKDSMAVIGASGLG